MADFFKKKNARRKKAKPAPGDIVNPLDLMGEFDIKPDTELPGTALILKNGRFWVPQKDEGPVFVQWRAQMRQWFGTECEQWPAGLADGINRHLKKRPFDLIRWGVLKIINKDAELVWFEINVEQRILLDWIEQEYYAGRPVRLIILKARQIGATTFLKACDACLARSRSYYTMFTVADRKQKAHEHREKIKIMFRHLPEAIRPKMNGKSSFHFDDPEMGVEDTKIFIDSAENGANVGIGFTIHHLNLSEGSHWRESAKGDVYTGIANSVPDRKGSIIFEESTGNQAQDVFYTRYFLAKESKLGRFRAFFFPWFYHDEYRLPLDEGIAGMNLWSEEEFWFNISEHDRDIARTYQNFDGSSLSAEQMNWYITKRSEQMYDSGGSSAEKFRRENPCNEEEAFLGAGATYFDSKRNKNDQDRTRRVEWVKLHELPEVCNTIDLLDKPVKAARATLKWRRASAHGRMLSAHFEDDEQGFWLVYERPRPGHQYVVSCDPAKGKTTLKGVRSSVDSTVVEVVRHTYQGADPTEACQVAYFRAQGVPPSEAALHAVGASIVYRDMIRETRALVIHDAVGHGMAFTDAAKTMDCRFYHHVKRDKEGQEVERTVGLEITTGSKGEASKSVTHNALRVAYNGGLYRLMNHISTLEFGTFAEIDGKLMAIPPHHDDCVSSAMLQIEGWRYEQGGNPTPAPVLASERQLALMRAMRLDDGEDIETWETPRELTALDKDWRGRNGIQRKVVVDDDGMSPIKIGYE